MEKLKLILLIFLITGMMIVPLNAQKADTVAPEKDIVPTEGKIITIEEFARLAAENDTEFEAILVDELTLKYQKALLLPPGDLLLSVKQQYEFFFDQERSSPDTRIALSKLFPYTGTELTADYGVGKSLTSAAAASDAAFTLSQPIARNAFGRSTRLLDKIVGLEVEIAGHQIVEAYEDYMAIVLTAYHNWYEDHENLKIGQASYKANMRLLDNIYERQKQKVALPIDVNKVKLQVMTKREQLIELEERYQNSLRIVERMIRHSGNEVLIPAEPQMMEMPETGFETSFESFRQESRTFAVLRKLEKRAGFRVLRDADDLLPSIDLLIGYEVSGRNFVVNEEKNFMYTGIQLDWPIGHQTERAEYEISKILERRTKLESVNDYYRLDTRLYNLYLQMEREKKLIKIAEERIELAEAVLKDESENYSFGKVTLNDFIQAVNALDTNRFNLISHHSLYKKLIVEWRRLTDLLVQKVPPVTSQ